MASHARALSINEPGPSAVRVAVTPSDTVDLPDGPCRGIHCNVAGDVKMTDLAGNAVVMTLLAGVPYAYACTRIWSTGTTATGIRALY